MVSNTGDAGATSIVAPELPSPYAFAGGAFPGTGGDCGDSLAARETCTMVVEFAPQLFGTATQELSLDYDSPEGPAFVAVDLTGIGAGTSENLIVNPGGELGGAPPVGWTEAVGDDWTVYDDFSRSGDYCIVGGLVQGQPGTYRLEQTFSLSSHVDVIDHQAGLAIAYAGYARTWSQNDDIYRFSLRTLDGSGNVVDSIETPDGTGSSWSLRELDLVTKPGVREVEIQVICIFNAGSACDAFFDDLSLTLSYPPA
jgi:hypothetical protein